MKKLTIANPIRFTIFVSAVFLVTCVGMLGVWHFLQADDEIESYTADEVGFELPEESIRETSIGFNDQYTVSELENWQRPQGPVRVAIQAGHWKNSEVPEELDGLKRNGGGAVGGGLTEQEVVLEIAEQVTELLKEYDLTVDLLPTTVPPGYVADAFISIHADGNLDTSVSGFKIASPWRDYSEKSETLEKLLYETYADATNLATDPSISRRMRGYYAFNWRRYDHAIHPMTPAVIIETGFLTSPSDRRIIVQSPDLAARGIADGIIAFLQSESLLQSSTESS